MENYIPEEMEAAKQSGHGGSDFYSMYNFVEKILGNPDTDVIDVYEAMDMYLPGIFAYRSILKGSIPMAIPNLRNKEERDQYRNDTMCTDPKVAGDQLLPTCSTGTPEIGQEVYQRQYDLWKEWYEKEKNEEKQG